ncbi:MAG: tail fiber domain-containing protein [Bacteroidetes bacterium]|nr:tail fiber domain-containing protein [Bacteroidota bacterium]
MPFLEIQLGKVIQLEPWNTFLGSNAGSSNTTGFNNTYIGRDAGAVGAVGFANVFIGYFSGVSNTANYNTFVGEQSGSSHTSGTYSAFFGRNAGLDNSTGSNNTFIGGESGLNNTTGAGNTALGYNSGFATGALTNATAIGANAVVNTSNSIVLGNAANVGIGTSAPTSLLHVEGNTYINGTASIGGTTGLAATLKVFSGFGAGTAYFFDSGGASSLSVLSGGDVTIGNSTSVSKLFIQDNDANTTGATGSFVSVQNLSNTTNTTAGIRFRTGGLTGINGDFHYKGAIYFQDNGSTNGEGNMIFAVNNVASSANVTTANAVMTITNTARIGIGTTAPLYQIELSTNSAGKPTSNTWTITSDERLKNIEGNYTKGLNEILLLQPITYHYKNVGDRTFDEAVLKEQAYGFSAQEVRKIFPEAVKTGEDGYLNFDIHPILIAYVNAIKEQQEMIKKQQEQIELLIKKVGTLEETNKSQK